MRGLPNALFVGPQKTGTTWIHEYLKKRGDVGLPVNTKETYFFDQNYHLGLSWYARHFSHLAEIDRIVEVAPSYFDSPEAALRVFRDLGDILVLITFREPVSRTYSNYLQALRYGWTRSPFIEAIETLPILIRPSMYATHLKRWLAIFGWKSIRVLFQEDLGKNPKLFASQVCQYLGLTYRAPDLSIMNSKVNMASIPQNYFAARLGYSLSQKLQRMGLLGVKEWMKKTGLQRYFFGKPGSSTVPVISDGEKEIVLNRLLAEIDELEQLLNIDLSHWKKGGMR